jgi:hypothetical protein
VGGEPDRESPGKGSLSIKAAAAIDRGSGAIQLGHLILLIQEVQRVVAWETTDGELVGHLGPVLTVRGHTLVQLCCLGEQVLQHPGGLEVKNQNRDSKKDVDCTTGRTSTSL